MFCTLRPYRTLSLFLIIISLVTIAWVYHRDVSSSNTPLTTAEQEQGMVTGLPFKDPPDLNVASPPNLNIRLVAAATQFDLNGKKVSGDSYDGSYTGPTLHFQPGEHVTITLVNKLPTATNLHFHGMHLSPSGSADNPYISVAPGHTFTYHLDIPLNQPQGTFWYHDHNMCMGTEMMNMPSMPSHRSSGSSCADVESQIFAGLSGTIIVGDDRSLLPANLKNITAHTMVFKDLQIDSSGHVIQNKGSESINSDNSTVRLVNGQLRPVLTMRPGETQLWRLSNEGADISYDLQLNGYTFTVVGQDGYPVAQVTTAKSLSLPPGKRYDVLVTASSHSAQTWLRTVASSTGPEGDSYPDVELVKVEVGGALTKTRPMPIGATLTSTATLANAPIAQNRTITLSENSDGTKMYINGEQFNMNKSIFSTPAVLGSVEQWTIVNDSGEIHPFHVHTDHFQAMSVNGVQLPYVGEQDTVSVPYKKNGVPGQVVIRIHFTDFTGKIMFHCHIASHEDAGMMSFINVVNPSLGFSQNLIFQPQ